MAHLTCVVFQYIIGYCGMLYHASYAIAQPYHHIRLCCAMPYCTTPYILYYFMLHYIMVYDILPYDVI